MKRLGTDLTSAQKEMKAKHKAYENAVGILSRRLQEALSDKEAAEAELLKLKAQVSDQGNSQALQVLKHHSSGVNTLIITYHYLPQEREVVTRVFPAAFI